LPPLESDQAIHSRSFGLIFGHVELFDHHVRVGICHILDGLVGCGELAFLHTVGAVLIVLRAIKMSAESPGLVMSIAQLWQIGDWDATSVSSSKFQVRVVVTDSC